MNVIFPAARRLTAALMLVTVLCWFASPVAAQLPKRMNNKAAVNLWKKIGFEIGVENPNDPFDPANQTGASMQKPVPARPGQTFLLTVTGNPKGDNYTYPIKPLSEGMSPSKLSKLEFYQAGTPGLRIVPGVTESTPKEKVVEGVTEYAHVKPFTWKQQVTVSPDAQPGLQTLYIVPRVMICDHNNCTDPGGMYPPRKLVFDVSGDPLSLNEAQQKQLKVSTAPRPVSEDQLKQLASLEAELAAEQAKEIPAAPENVNVSKTRPTDPPGDVVINPGEGDLGGLLGAAFLGAFLMLLTPCVFPMIPITVNFFLKQSEREHHNALSMACVYSGTIIVLLTLVMLFLGNVVISLANDPWFNLLMGGVLVFFALSLFGMFEIQLPSGLARFTSAREGQGGYFGALFMALTFTITSFTCTGPFLGAMIGGIASVRPPFHYLLLASLVYATTFAAPFFVLALFPSVLKKLPKSGSWMSAIKVCMAFVELAAALKFLSIADVAWSPGDPRFFTYDSVLCAWIALSVVCGLYLIGAFRLPHDHEDVASIGVLRMMFAVGFFGLAMYMTPALFGAKPLGVVGENLVAFLPPKFEGEWHLDYKTAWQEARDQKKLIFIDFTGVHCQNCRDNEKNVFPDPRVKRLLKDYVVVQLYTDSVPIKGLDAAQAKELAERNARWRDALGDTTNPYYFIFEPGETPFTQDDLLNGRKLGSRNGKIYNVNDFVRFLERRPGTASVASAK